MDHYILGAGIGTLFLKKSGLMTSLIMVFKRNYIPKWIPYYNQRFSIRYDLIKNLQLMIKKVEYKNGEYILVKGEKGIGKSLLIKTVLHHKGGVSDLTITSDNVDIYNLVLNELFGVMHTNKNPFHLIFKESLRSIIFWHKIFLFGRAPIVVIEIFESGNLIKYHNDVRRLAKLGLIIIVDASDSSVENRRESKQMRQHLIYVEKFSMNELECIKKFKPVLNRLIELDKKRLMEIFIGGIPYYYIELLQKNIISGIKYKNKEEKIKIELMHKKEINDVITIFYHSNFARVEQMISKNKHNKRFMDFLLKYKNSTGYYTADEIESTFILNIEESCFRTICKDGEMCIIPVSNSIDIILKYQLNENLELSTENFDIKNYIKIKTINELESLLKIGSKMQDESIKEKEKKHGDEQIQKIQENNKL